MVRATPPQPPPSQPSAQSAPSCLPAYSFPDALQPELGTANATGLIERHCGASYVEQALSADEWDGPCCRPPPSVEALVTKAAPRLADESDEEEDSIKAEARLLAIESELAAAQEALEEETVERQKAEIRGELATTHTDDLDELVEAELAEWTRLCEKRLANCEREHAHAQDRAERAGIDGKGCRAGHRGPLCGSCEANFSLYLSLIHI